MLPVDYLVTDSLDFNNKTLGDTQVVKKYTWRMGRIDAGPKTTQLYAEEVSQAKTVLWNEWWEYLKVKGRVKVHLLS